MYKEIKFKKNRVILGILFFSLMLCVSVFFVVNPEVFVRNVFIKIWYIQFIGLAGIVYYLTLLYSFFRILPRKYAIIITDDYLIDNSKYESLGKIRWTDISKIQRLKKRSIEMFLRMDGYKTEKKSFLKRFLSMLHNWNYKKSILISSALMECSVEELFDLIVRTYRLNKKLQDA